MATDMMVRNISKDKITERMAVSTDEAWPIPTDAIPPKRDPGYPNPYSKWLLDGRWDDGVQPVQKKMLDEFMEKYNLQDQDWRKQYMKKQ